MNATKSQSNHTTTTVSRRIGYARVAAVALVGFLPLGCAHHPEQTRQMQVYGKGAQPCNVIFLAPDHLPKVPVAKNVETPVVLTAKWRMNGNDKFDGGKVSVFLFKDGKEQYCKSCDLAPDPKGLGFQTVTLKIMGKDSTGVHDVKCYITGKCSPGVDMLPMSHNHGTAAHCKN